MDTEFKERMLDLSKKIDIDLSNEEIEQFYSYMNLLLEWNEKINLTSITEKNDIILKHFIDSMSALKYIDEDCKLIDVGTGAGFPGIPIGILKQKTKITLLDSLNKRIIFLNEVIKKLDLKNICAIHNRAEDFGRENKEKYDIGISRAVASLPTLVEYIIPPVRVGGKCICMKGAEIDEEIKNAEFAIKELGGKIFQIEKFNLPDSNYKRTIIIIEKIKNTPNEYPRRSGLPQKQPLMGKNGKKI